MAKKDFVTDKARYIGQLNGLYWKIVKTPSIAVEKLDKANEVVCEAIEKLRPLVEAM